MRTGPSPQLEQYRAAGMKLAQALDAIWDQPLSPFSTPWTSLQEHVDRYRDACSALARATEEVDE